MTRIEIGIKVIKTNIGTKTEIKTGVTGTNIDQMMAKRNLPPQIPLLKTRSTNLRIGIKKEMKKIDTEVIRTNTAVIKIDTPVLRINTGKYHFRMQSAFIKKNVINK